MKYDVILLDFDGVISPGKDFMQIYSEEFNVPIGNLILELKPDANIGKVNLEDILTPEILEQWQWKRTKKELLDYWMSADSVIDERFIPVVTELRKNGVKVYLATEQEKYRTEFIWNERGLKNWLDGRFVSFEVGYHKHQKEFFEHIIKTLNVNPKYVVYFDDSQSKIDAAREAGIIGYLYSDFTDFFKIIKTL